MLLSLALAFLISGVLSVMGTVTVQAAEPTVNKKTQTLNVGQQVTVQVKNAGQKVKWSSSNKKVVKVKSTSGSKKEKAKIEALKAGKATITATVGTKKLKVNVTVRSFTISKKSATVNEGKAITLTAKNAGKKISWSTSNKSVIKVVETSGSKNTKVSVLGVAPGTATLTGKIGTVKVQTKITVKHVHKYSEATCDKAATCACGAVSGQPLGHLAGTAATCTTGQYCQRCNILLVQPLGHNMSVATCQKAATCQRPGCGYTEGGLADHDWNYDTGFCRTPGCNEMNLNHFISMSIDNCGSRTDLVRVRVSNQGRYELQLCDGDGKATVSVPSASLQIQARAWDPEDGEAIGSWRVPSGARGYVYFGTTNIFGIDFDTILEYDIFYNHIKYHVKVTEDGFTYEKR